MTGESGILVGTSGWSYGSWRGPFFPPGLPARLHLQFYAERFRTTELNGVFYRTPTEQAVRSWAEQTPEGFVFAWKASKFITHWKRLKDTSRNSLDLLESRRGLLGAKAGPILFQLPPRFEKDRERLAAFFKLLRAGRQYAFEFRHPSWYEDDILELLREHDMALCISDHHEAPAPWLATARHVYVRGHGPSGKYHGRYPLKTLETWRASCAACVGPATTLSCTSTTTRRAPRRRTRCVSPACSQSRGPRPARRSRAAPRRRHLRV